MKPEKLAEVLQLAQKTGFVLVGTADEKGTPHIAAAGRLELSGNSAVVITEWFCPNTVANLQKNNSVSAVIWSKKIKNGYQLIGQVQTINDVGILDGFSPALENKPPMPQIEKQLIINVTKILEFRLGPHSDLED